MCAAVASVHAAGGVRETPAYEVLKALDLLDVSPPQGESVARLNLSAAPGSDPLSARGSDILRFELARVDAFELRTFDLLYNGERRLIAVFPVFPAESKGPKGWSPEFWRKLSPSYLDLSPYYAPVGLLRDRTDPPAWEALARAYESDRAVIEAYLGENFAFLRDIYPKFFRLKFPYRLHELGKETGDWFAYGFNPKALSKSPDEGGFISTIAPEELRRRLLSDGGGVRRLVIPKFPTVYVVPTFTPDELEYMRGVYKRFDLGPESEILVVGPGTGVDSWVASLRTERPVHAIGINPLEVANTEATARIAGFEVRAMVGDNVVDAEGKPRFPGARFDAVFWSMPSFNPGPKPGARFPLEELWDGDTGGSILKRFASGLPEILKPGGTAFLWNFAWEHDGVNEVSEILKRAGTEEEIFEVEEERFSVSPHRGAKAKAFKARLYTVSFKKR